MPTYLYRFDDGTEIVADQSIHDDAWTEAIHPVWCRIMPVRRIPQAPGIALKGKGFYRTGG